LHIGLNLIYLVPGETGGMETCARELIPELVSLAPEVKFTAFINKEAAQSDQDAPWKSLIPSVTVPVFAQKRTEWVRGEQQLLPRIAARTGVDLVHSLGNTGPAWGSFKRVVSINDIHYKVVPDAHFGLRGLGMRVLVPLAARRSDRVVAISQATANDLTQHLGIKQSKIDVIHLGVRSGPTGGSEKRSKQEVRELYGLKDRKVLLTLSAKRPHKNLVRLIEALAQISPEDRPVLLMPGYRTPYEDELKTVGKRLEVMDDLRFPQWLSATEVEELYEVANAFVFPSLNEGFGLPVLEAMAHGLPVATSSVSSMPEVAGDAALLFDPCSVVKIRESIQSLLTDVELTDRLVKLGYQRVKEMSWRRSAEKTLETYRKVLG